jgi:hypothetical protein
MISRFSSWHNTEEQRNLSDARGQKFTLDLSDMSHLYTYFEFSYFYWTSHYAVSAMDVCFQKKLIGI